MICYSIYDKPLTIKPQIQKGRVKSEEEYFKFEGDIIVKYDKTEKLFYRLTKDGKWVEKGRLLSWYLDPGYEVEKISKEDISTIFQS